MLRATPISVPKNNCVFSSEDGARENCLTILYGYAHVSPQPTRSIALGTEDTACMRTTTSQIRMRKFAV